MTDKEYQIFISALSTRYWRSGVTLYIVVQTVPTYQHHHTTKREKQKLSTQQNLTYKCFIQFLSELNNKSRRKKYIFPCYKEEPLPHESIEQDMVMLLDQENTQGKLYQIFLIHLWICSWNSDSIILFPLFLILYRAHVNWLRLRKNGVRRGSKLKTGVKL